MVSVAGVGPSPLAASHLPGTRPSRRAGAHPPRAAVKEQAGYLYFPASGELDEARRATERCLVQYRFSASDRGPLSRWAQLEAVGRELDSVSESQHAGLAAAAAPWSPGSALLPFEQALANGAAAAAVRPVVPEGSGREVLLQAFNWESWRGGWYDHVTDRSAEIAELGFTAVWLPPPTQSVSPQGYMPGDLYNLNSYYGDEAQLRSCVARLRSSGLKVLGDAVLNHRCAAHTDEHGRYNHFGGRLDWGPDAIVPDGGRFGGRGAGKRGALFDPAPNIDHSHTRVKSDLCAWLAWLRADVGFDGWRLDFVRGFCGSHVADYMAASTPAFAVGEYWDAMDYGFDGQPTHCQNAHRQRIVDWINAAGGSATAFDVTTKGVLHAALGGQGQLWRLRDTQGRAPGVLGLWPSRAVTFLENHDTGSTQGHWRFPAQALERGYAYLFTHPGTPSVFWDHVMHWGPGLRSVIARLARLRARNGLHCRSSLNILAAEPGHYAAEVDGKVCVKLGPDDWQPACPSDWTLTEWGDQWAVWERRR